MTLNEAIKEAQVNNALSAEARNSLHAATKGHPLCAGKTLDQRISECVFALHGKVNSIYIHNIQRAKS